MLYIKRLSQHRMSFADLLTLHEYHDLLECDPYVGKIPGETGG